MLERTETDIPRLPHRRRRRSMRWVRWTAALAAASASLASPPTARNAERGVVGITAPFEAVTLASVQAAKIESIAAPEGGTVRRGDIVVQLDERAQAARTEIAKAGAETTLNIEHAKARWDRAQRDLERLRKLHGSDFASSKEMSDAIADERIARAEHDLAYFNQVQSIRAYERENATLEASRLRAPFDGYVAQHLKHVGECISELEGVVTLVQLHPLKVLLDCPMDWIPAIAVGQRYWVRPVDPRFSARPGAVIFASRVADGGSQTFRVKLAVDNGDALWPAGLKVAVDFREGEIAPGDAASASTPPTEGSVVKGGQ